MRKNLITTICMAVLAIAAIPASAQQKGDMAVGAKIAFGTDNGFNTVGFGAKFQYNVTDPIRLEGSFSYFLPMKISPAYSFSEFKTSRWDVSANAHYLFPVGSGIVVVYPLAGLAVLGTHSTLDSLFGDHKVNKTDFGVNLGAGADFTLSERWAVNAEAKYMIAGEGLFVLSAGAAFKF